MPWWDPLSWFGGAERAAVDWFSSTAGSLASGLEGAFVALFKDTWLTIEGAVYILIGIVFLLAAFFLLVRADPAIAAAAGAAMRT